LASPGVLVLAVDPDDRLALLMQHSVSTTHWVLVAGYNRVGETAEETVRREVAEETGLRVTSCRYVASYFHAGKQALLLGFVARVVGELSRDSAEIDDLRWIDFADAGPFLRPGSIGMRLYRETRALRSR
jgi:NAD+ diphosphatase